MNGEDRQASTFERSCRHWSEQGREEMDAFYRLATIDYELLAQQLDWGRLLARVADRLGDPIRLLDIACGSGQFPTALLRHGNVQARGVPRVAYSLLDPSAFSIGSAREKLAAPFVADEEFQCTAQQFVAPRDPFAIIWATHALYCVPTAELPLAIERLSAALDPAGLGFIAHAGRESHYVRFHERFLQTSPGRGREPFCCGEQVLEALHTRSGQSLPCWTIDYTGTVPLDDRKTVEQYLQRCLFDDTLSLEAMTACGTLGPYLRACQDEDSGLWRFPQQVWLMFFGGSAAAIGDLRRQ